MDNDIVSFGQVISNTFKNISSKDVENANVVFDTWKKVLYSIKGVERNNHPANKYEGQNMYDHSRVVDLKNGVLLVEADHPGWIQLLQMHKEYILNGLNRAAPQLTIRTLAFRLKGKKGELYDTENENENDSAAKIRSNIEQQAENDEQKISLAANRIDSVESDKAVKQRQNKELPPELKAIFEDLKKSMLTNSEK